MKPAHEPGVRPLIAATEIRSAVERMGAQISADYAGRPLTLLGVLTGSIVLVADLMRRITLPHKLGLIQTSSYRGRATMPGELELNLRLLPEVAGRDVLLVDDVLDTGRTLSALMAALRERGTASVRSAVLLWKSSRTEGDLRPDYCGFEIPDEFVVGYGLDYNDDYRHLPYVGALTTPRALRQPGA